VLLHSLVTCSVSFRTKWKISILSPGQGLRTRAKRTTGKQGLRYTPRPEAPHYVDTPPVSAWAGTMAVHPVRWLALLLDSELQGVPTRRRTDALTESHPGFPQLLASARLSAGLLQGCFGPRRASFAPP
jgi:hypothetical protein